MFFFFKQKTAYEMRISDWSSDVCSSDLQGTYASSGLPLSLLTPGTPAYQAVVDGGNPNREFEFRTTGNGPGASLKGVELSLQLPFSVFSDRSEEHTSELQSLMRISYAVFCLKKKKKHNIIDHTQ